jgi:hypothetical protein
MRGGRQRRSAGGARPLTAEPYDGHPGAGGARVAPTARLGTRLAPDEISRKFPDLEAVSR